MGHLNQLFLEAGALLLTGMVFVFVFLGLMVVFINTVLAKLAITFPDAVVQTRPQRVTKKKNNVTDGVSPQVVAAISSAVAQYRQQNPQQKSNK